MTRGIGLDLGTHSLRALVVERKGPILEILRALEVPVAGEGEDAVLAATAELSRLGKAAGARFSVSGKDVIIRYTQVPPVAPWRMRLLLDLEVKEMAHQAGSPLAADYNIVGGGKGEQETVLVAVAREPFLAARFDALRNSSGEARSAMPGSIALFNAWLTAGALHEGEVVMLADIGERNTEVVLLKDGELLFARNLSAGGALFTDAVAGVMGTDRDAAAQLKAEHGNVDPKARGSYASGKAEKVSNAMLGPAGQLASMLQSSLAFARAQSGDPQLKPARLCISGGGAALKGLTAYLESALSIKCSRFQPDSGLDASKLPEDERVEFERDPGRFVIALGLAAAEGAKQAFTVDLVPSALKKSREFSRDGLWRWVAAVVLVGFLGWSWWDQSGRATDISTQVSAARVKAQAARRRDEEYRKELAAVASLNARQKLLVGETETACAFALGALLVQQSAPDGVWIEQVDARRGPFPKDPNDPKLGKEVKTLLTISGEVMSVDVQFETALQQMLDGIRSRHQGARVRIIKQSAPSGAGAKKLGFTIEADLFPDTAEAVNDAAGGN
jgi:type IV pilus assembly protein PilM